MPWECATVSTWGNPLGLAASFSWQRRQRLATSGSLGTFAPGSSSVFGQGAMAGLASHTRMFSGVVHFGFLLVAERALASARIGDGQGRDHVKGARPVVSVFAKVFGHHGGAKIRKTTTPASRTSAGRIKCPESRKKRINATPKSETVLLSAMTAGQGPPQASLCLNGQYWDQTVGLSSRLLV